VDSLGNATVSISSPTRLNNIRRRLVSCWDLGNEQANILKIQDRQRPFGVAADEDRLIRHQLLTASDRLEIDLRRHDHNSSSSLFSSA
jgi:hypothetical protein